MREPTRREVLRGLGVLSATAVVSSCSRGPATVSSGATSASGTSSPSGTTSGAPQGASPTSSAPGTSPSAAARATLPPVVPWTARPGEVAPAVKRRAVRLVEAVASWPTGHGGLTAARRRVAALGLDGALADQMTPLLGPGESAVAQVVDAQYGGILAASASVLVVVDQWLIGRDGALHAGGTTLDVRLVAASPRWRPTEVHPARPGRAASGLSRAARRVLGNDRIHLPHAAAADVRSGHVHDSVLRSLTALSGDHVLDVSVLRSGHPLFVFGTSRRSDHPFGRAADVWALDGRPVVDPANRSLVLPFMRAASRTGPWQVGGPVDLDGGGTAFFSDATHRDHVHMGFRS
ncbi:MAG: hypothetical protein ACXVF1_15890 [Nocardioidaceae bacterium]